MRNRLDINYNGNRLSIDNIRCEVDWVGKVKVSVKNIRGEIKQKVNKQKIQSYKDDEFFQFYDDEKSELSKTNRNFGC